MPVLAPPTKGIVAVAAGLVLLGTEGCATLPPPPDVSAPIERAIPVLPSAPAPPPPGRGLVILDSVSGPARAMRILAPSSSTVPAEAARSGQRAEDQVSAPLCSTTPCAAYLPYGTQQVLLESNVDTRREASYLLDVTDKPLVLRASLDANLPAGRGRVPGAVLLMSGLGFMTLGVTMAASNEDARSSQAIEAVGWTAFGVGAAVAVLGGILWWNNAPVHHKGHAIQWNPEQSVVPAAPVPPLP